MVNCPTRRLLAKVADLVRGQTPAGIKAGLLNTFERRRGHRHAKTECGGQKTPAHNLGRRGFGSDRSQDTTGFSSAGIVPRPFIPVAQWPSREPYMYR